MRSFQFHPTIARWFEQKCGSPTEPQQRGWPAIQAGGHTLIAAPTGSGKTLAAFFASLDRLFREGLEGKLRDETRVLYVSPLKALSNDIHKNLEEPLTGIRAALLADEGRLIEVRAEVRTGDTPASKRRAILRKPPHILVTTPESFYLLLTSPSGRKMLGTVRTLIVDEIHALVANRRGSHLAISMERLAALVNGPLQRIGLSATQKPIEEVAKFLVGAQHLNRNGQPRCTIVDTGHKRAMDLAIAIGWVDLVCQIGTTRSIATFLQRVGRADHKRHGLPKGRLFPLTRDELVECAAMLRSVRRGELDCLHIPQKPLDILAQQI